MSANSTPSALWAAYRRALARESAARREADAAYAAWEAAATRRRAAAADAESAHRVYMRALSEAAVVADAEDIAFNLPHLFTDEH